MKKIISTLILILILPLTSCYKTDIVYSNELYDGLTNDNKLVLPFDEIESIFIDNYLYFKTKNDLSLNDIKEKLESNGYYVENQYNFYNEECLIISLYIGNKLTPLFIIEGKIRSGLENENMKVSPLIISASNCVLSFPMHLAEYPQIFSVNTNKDFNEYGQRAKTRISFQEIYNYYNIAMTNIVKVDIENKTLIINAIDTRMGNCYNALAQIKYIESNEGNYIEVTRIYDMET